ncbi:MAG: 4Fe-4S cluster-binding domain-containing protein [bacterium]|nr:4Fe-4S cluster-binding domain-containing protein [bacterium]
MMQSYTVKEIFYSLQGEGARAGTANVFVRFAGCNLDCAIFDEGFDCDTDFSGGKPMTGDYIVRAARGLGYGCRWVLFTGGEPALQLDQELVDRFHGDGWAVAVETNGTRHLPDGIDWIAMSPKTDDDQIAVWDADEIRYVLVPGLRLPEKIPHNGTKVPMLYASPAFEGDVLPPDNLAWCLEQVKRNPEDRPGPWGWRLSVQQHKGWGIR